MVSRGNPRAGGDGSRDRGERPADNGRTVPPTQGDGFLRYAARQADRHRCRRRDGKAPQARRASGVQAHRYMRRRIRFAHGVYVFNLRGAVRRKGRRRGGAVRPEEGRHSRRRSEPHRPGNRVRLLLLPCRLRAERGRLRDHHGQLQSGNRVDRLRHVRPALFRTAHAGRRTGNHRHRAL